MLLAEGQQCENPCSHRSGSRDDQERLSRTDELQHEAFPTVADRRKGMSSKSTGLMQGFLWLGNEIIFR